MTVTLKDYMVLQNLVKTASDEKNLNRAILRHFKLTDLPIDQSDKKVLEIKSIIESEPTFYPTFKHKGIEYGFIPNLDKITTGEYIDLDYLQSDEESLHKVMAILYRPVDKKYKGTYTIKKYDPDNMADTVMLETDVKYYLGAMVFFYHLSNELLNATLISTQSELTKIAKMNP